jgi:hypothetical protein
MYKCLPKSSPQAIAGGHSRWEPVTARSRRMVASELPCGSWSRFFPATTGGWGIHVSPSIPTRDAGKSSETAFFDPTIDF